MAASAVPFRIPGCRFDAVQTDPSDLAVDASSKAHSAVCPACGQRSRRVHGLYTRSPADLPVSDLPVGLRLRVRRFRCMSETCPRRTFAEPFPDLVARYARRTDRLAASQVRTGLTTGAEPGARLLRDLRMPTSPDTVLRLIHRHPVPVAETPRVLGVDDWAWRKGRAWGTILIDTRWTEGERRALALHREIQALGYTGSAHPVSVWAQGRRTEPHPCTPRRYLEDEHRGLRTRAS